MATTYIALAAAFVYSAYLYCLVNSKVIELDTLTPEQTQFFYMLKNRDSSWLLKQTEQQLWAMLLEFFKADNLQQELSKDTPLAVVAKQFLASSVFKDVMWLLEETQQFYIAR